MADIPVVLPNGTEIPGERPIVILGPNGSGKTRLSRRLTAPAAASVEFINALRNTRASRQVPAVSRSQALREHSNQKDNSRNQPWEIASDFDAALGQLLADDGDAARTYRHRHKTGQSLEEVEDTAAEVVQRLWHLVFPGRSLDWSDWSPIVLNEIVAGSYSANQMSDGERAALYVLSKVLLIGPGSVLVVDEPETHFHEELAVRLWDAIEAARRDVRFVYVTHDVSFALSREPARYLLAHPALELASIELDEAIPSEIRHKILGAASFSYYASRAVFCEGADHSLDKGLFMSWFAGRDTVVVAVGSGDVVRRCVQAFRRTKLLSNLEALGIVDRDFRSDAQLAALTDVVSYPSCT